MCSQREYGSEQGPDLQGVMHVAPEVGRQMSSWRALAESARGNRRQLEVIREGTLNTRNDGMEAEVVDDNRCTLTGELVKGRGRHVVESGPSPRPGPAAIPRPYLTTPSSSLGSRLRDVISGQVVLGRDTSVWAPTLLHCSGQVIICSVYPSPNYYCTSSLASSARESGQGKNSFHCRDKSFLFVSSDLTQFSIYDPTSSTSGSV